MNKVKNKQWGPDDQLMAMAAFRYCLGRQSYIVETCISWVRSNLEKLDINTVRIIARDTLEAIIDEAAGSKTTDEPGWMQLFKELYAHIPQEDREWLLSQIRRRNHMPRYEEVIKELMELNNDLYKRNN
jgi:hypothetical protein